MREKEEAVRRMQRHIETHLSEDISLAALSTVAKYSPWYAARLFKEGTGLPPAEYIRRLRLSQSALRLQESGASVADTAFASGFTSVDGYQRAFQREFGLNPGAYARNPVPLPLFTPYDAKFTRVRKEPSNMENVRNVFVQVLEKPARKVLILRGVQAEDYFSYCEEVGCDLWNKLVEIAAADEPVCLWLPEPYKLPNTSTYVQGVEFPFDASPEIPEGMDLIELPAATYLMFQGEPFDEALYESAIGDVKNAMEKYDPSLIGYVWDDTNPRVQLAPIGTRGYIELRAVRKR